MSEKEYNLGLVSSFTDYPAEVRVEDETYFLVCNDANYQLLSSVCPHAGGTVMNYGTSLVCPLHYWSFDKNTGVCATYPSVGLETIKVIEREGYLFAAFPAMG